MSHVKMKETDLYEIIAEMINAVMATDSLNKVRVCNFILNLVNNGGNQTQAAREAGYGQAITKDGKKQTEQERNNVAGVEACRLLRLPKIREVYEKIFNSRMAANAFAKSFTREDAIAVFWRAGLKQINENPENPSAGFKALREAALLARFYDMPTNISLNLTVEESEKLMKQKQEMQQSVHLLEKIEANMRVTKPKPLEPIEGEIDEG